MSIKVEVAQAVAKEKASLRRQTRRLGLVHENFGQNSVRKLNDQYFGLAYGDPEERSAYRIIADFEDWCERYTGD